MDPQHCTSDDRVSLFVPTGRMDPQHCTSADRVSVFVSTGRRTNSTAHQLIAWAYLFLQAEWTNSTAHQMIEWACLFLQVQWILRTSHLQMRNVCLFPRGACLDRFTCLANGLFLFPIGSVDPYWSTDDPHYPSSRDRTRATVQRVPWQPKDMVVACEWRSSGGPRLLHVSSEHQPHDQPSGVPPGRRWVHVAFLCTANLDNNWKLCYRPLCSNHSNNRNSSSSSSSISGSSNSSGSNGWS
jgi:hypothetical protein